MPKPIDRDSRRYQVLGVHGRDVLTGAGDVARVRMYIGEQAIDEDFPLPQVITVEQQLDTAVKARLAELTEQMPTEAGNTEVSQ